MFELDVPFLEKDLVKELGARWNTKTKKWFVPSGVDPEVFRKWWPIGVNLEQTAATSCSLSTFLNKIKDVINQSFPDRDWIVAEISEITAHNGNYFITLVEYDEEGHKQAQINARIWRENAALLEKFKTATGSELTAGIKVLLLASVAFHPQYGLSLTVDDVDPNYTLGDMIAKINKIKQQLQQEKIFTNNKQLPTPIEFTRIAVISPIQAAGLGDFSREADLLSKYHLCEFVYFTATFQGKAAPSEIIQAINQIIVAHQQQPFDAMVIIRGGGSVADLAWLNDVGLARAVCLCPLHVMVGVGHKRDHTILDDVAAGKFDTPSKVVAHIFQVIVQNAEDVTNDFTECVKITQQILLVTSNELNRTIGDLNQDVIYHLECISNELATTWQLLIENLRHQIITEGQHVTALIREILCQGPEAILNKGFAIAVGLTGEIITSYSKALMAKKFKLKFHDGVLLVNDSCEIDCIGSSVVLG